MTIELDFYAFLVGVPGSPEIYPVVLPEKRTLPALTYAVNGSRPQYSTDGPSAYEITFRVDCWANTYAAVKTLQGAVRTLLDGYSGVMGSHYAHNVEIENEIDDFEPDTKLYRVSIQINIFHRIL